MVRSECSRKITSEGRGEGGGGGGQKHKGEKRGERGEKFQILEGKFVFLFLALQWIVQKICGQKSDLKSICKGLPQATNI